MRRRISLEGSVAQQVEGGGGWWHAADSATVLPPLLLLLWAALSRHSNAISWNQKDIAHSSNSILQIWTCWKWRTRIFFQGCHIVASWLFTHLTGLPHFRFFCAVKSELETEDSSTFLPGNFNISVSISHRTHLIKAKRKCTKNPAWWLHAIRSLQMEVGTNLEESQAMSVRPGPFSLQFTTTSSIQCFACIQWKWASSPWQHYSNMCKTVSTNKHIL